MDAADLRPDACLAKYSGVAIARHFALGFTLVLPLCAPAPLSAFWPGARKEAAPRVEQVAGAPPVASQVGGGRRRKVAGVAGSRGA